MSLSPTLAAIASVTPMDNFNVNAGINQTTFGAPVRGGMTWQQRLAIALFRSTNEDGRGFLEGTRPAPELKGTMNGC